MTDGSGHSWPLYARITVDGVPGGPVWTDPITGRYSVSLPQGHTYQLHTTAFRVDAWRGDLVRASDETLDAAFFDLDALPEPLTPSVPRTMTDLARFEQTGQFILG